MNSARRSSLSWWNRSKSLKSKRWKRDLCRRVEAGIAWIKVKRGKVKKISQSQSLSLKKWKIWGMSTWRSWLRWTKIEEEKLQFRTCLNKSRQAWKRAKLSSLRLNSKSKKSENKKYKCSRSWDYEKSTAFLVTIG